MRWTTSRRRAVTMPSMLECGYPSTLWPSATNAGHYHHHHASVRASTRHLGWGPTSDAPRRRNPAIRQRSRDPCQRGDVGVLEFRQDRCQVGRSSF